MTEAMLDTDLARKLFELECIIVQESEVYSFTSGLPSPIYTDIRQAISNINLRKVIVEGLVSTLSASFPTADSVAGIVTGGVPWAAWVSWQANLPLLYVRANAKDRGLKRQVEGQVASGSQCVLIEDLVSTGLSTSRAYDAVESDGISVIGALSVFSYGTPQAADRFNQLGLEARSLTSISALMDALQNDLSLGQLAAIHHWLDVTIPNFVAPE